MGDSFDGYVKSLTDIDAWYALCLSESNSLYAMLFEATTAYYHLIADAGIEEYKTWNDAMADCYDMWDDAMSDYYDKWDDLLEDAYDLFYDIIEDAYDTEGYNTASDAWEDMYESGRHIFWRNNEIAGEAAILHAYISHGLFPYNTKAAILGRGNIAQGAMKILNYMGADVTIYNRSTEKLFQKELSNYDVIVNAILWDTSRKDHIIYRDDLKRMKRGALIIDISCDKNGGVESSIPTSIENPLYVVDGITHYVVDHTPSIFWKNASESLSHEFVRFIDYLIEDKPTETLMNARNFKDGKVCDERINLFQNRIA